MERAFEDNLDWFEDLDASLKKVGNPYHDEHGKFASAFFGANHTPDHTTTHLVSRHSGKGYPTALRVKVIANRFRAQDLNGTLFAHYSGNHTMKIQTILGRTDADATYKAVLSTRRK